LAVAESSPLLVKYAALLAALLVLVAFGLRPALIRARSAPAVAAEDATKELPAGAEAVTEAALAAVEAKKPDPERLRAQEIFEQVTEHLKTEPTQSSRLLQSWIHSD
jgi:flagellar M-ring protein FliF